MVATVVTPETENPLVFQTLNYCDRCSVAMGKYRVWVDRWRIEEDGSGKSLELVLCNHHFSEHETAILAAGYEVDEL